MSKFDWANPLENINTFTMLVNNPDECKVAFKCLEEAYEAMVFQFAWNIFMVHVKPVLDRRKWSLGHVNRRQWRCTYIYDKALNKTEDAIKLSGYFNIKVGEYEQGFPKLLGDLMPNYTPD